MPCEASSRHEAVRLVQVRQLAEDLKPLIDLLARERLQALRAEALHRERAHHAAIEHGVLQHAAAHFALRSDVAHEAPGKTVARPGGIAHLVQWQRRGPKRMMPSGEFSIAKENRGA